MPNTTRKLEALTDGHKIVLGIIALLIMVVLFHGLFGHRPRGGQSALLFSPNASVAAVNT